MDIELLLAFQNFETINEVIQKALKAEEVANNQARILTSFRGIGQSFLKDKDRSPVCFHYREKVHLSFQCLQRRPTTSTLVTNEQEVEDHDEPKSNAQLTMKQK